MGKTSSKGHHIVDLDKHQKRQAFIKKNISRRVKIFALLYSAVFIAGHGLRLLGSIPVKDLLHFESYDFTRLSFWFIGILVVALAVWIAIKTGPTRRL